MTTKEQERKALAQIRKIVESLGEDSYVATAFEGCFDDAEENIENDFALSMNVRWQDAEQKVEKLAAENRELVKRAEEAEEIANSKIKSADSWCAKYHEQADNYTRLWNDTRAEQDKVEALQNEIIKLKAKLYDLMVAES